MKQYTSPHFLKVARRFICRILFVIPLAFITGSLVALFLGLLDWATHFRWHHSWLLWCLPLAGIGIHFLYKLWGKEAERGNNLIIDEIHEPGGGVPARMAPLVIITTVITHLFGGSAGREGTAVQVGGSMAGLLGRWLKLEHTELRILMISGIAAGFGAVFGTPVAGAVFALEVVAVGRIQYDALWPCFLVAILANMVCSAWGIHHTHYAIADFPPAGNGLWGIDFLLLLKVALAGIVFGGVSYFFTTLTHGIRQFTSRFFKYRWLIPVAGGAAIIALTYLLGTTDYLGLGVESQSPAGISIVNAFKVNGLTSFSWFWKLIFTAITLGTGFKGGEVTPLFFIGAALGNVLGLWMGVPVDLLAALGFIAVFAGATNTPAACTLMGVELFGGEHLLYYAVVCFVAYYFSGSKGIYTAQRKAFNKH